MREILWRKMDVRDALMDMGYTRKTADNMAYYLFPYPLPIFFTKLVEWVKRRVEKGNEGRRSKRQKRYLSIKMRDALALRREGLTYAQIGARMGIARFSAWRLVQRGLEREPKGIAKG